MALITYPYHSIPFKVSTNIRRSFGLFLCINSFIMIAFVTVVLIVMAMFCRNTLIANICNSLIFDFRQVLFSFHMFHSFLTGVIICVSWKDFCFGDLFADNRPKLFELAHYIIFLATDILSWLKAIFPNARFSDISYTNEMCMDTFITSDMSL